ncbi:MAG TPA: hypothetical protein PK365_12300 [Nitrospira sp.]|nr:hypothetical protein [Nitrospira sp.]HNG02004.1 hypothetical protein [Nitrospira sp.]
MTDIQSAIRALPRNADTLKTLLIAVDCYAADLYRASHDADLGAVSDLLTEAFAAFEAYEESNSLVQPLTREEWRDEQAGMDGYKEVA